MEQRLSDEHLELMDRIRPVDVPDVPCTECIPSFDGRTIRHTDECPLMRSIDDECNNDRLWFESHPGAEFFYREISWGEAVELAALHPDLCADLPNDLRLTAQGKVRVERVADGVRFRRFEDIYFVVDSI